MMKEEISPLVIVVDSDVGSKIIAAKDMPSGTVISSFSSPVESLPNIHTVCIGTNMHVQPTMGTKYTAHSCGDTNMKLIISDDYVASFILSKDVKAHETLCFNYCTSEWTMDAPFLCKCDRCCKYSNPQYVQGFKHLSKDDQIKLLPECTGYIQSLAKEECLLKN